MQLYAVVYSSPVLVRAAVPCVCDDKDNAVDAMKGLVVAKWRELNQNAPSFPWFEAMLDDLIANRNNCCVTLPAADKEYGLVCTEDSVRIKAHGTVYAEWSVHEVGRVDVGTGTLADASEDYEFKNVRTTVEYEIQGRFPDADMESESVKYLVANIATLAQGFMQNGFNEEWAVEQAFKEKAGEVDALLETD